MAGMNSGLGRGRNAKRTRLILLSIALGALALAGAMIFSALDDNLVFFIAPSDISKEVRSPLERFRLGGMVEEGSIETFENGLDTHFRLTDYAASVSVIYRGIVPDLFAENQGAIVEGYLNDDNIFVADTLLAKHDENYMPPEVADALERSRDPNNASQ